MLDFGIVDTHVHLWDTNKFSYPWLRDVPALDRPFLLADYHQACKPLQIDALVFIQCEVDVSQALDEAKWIMDLAQNDHRIKAIIPWAPLEKGENCRSCLEKLVQSPLVKGVRRIIQFESDLAFCLNPDFIKCVQILADYDLSFDICINHAQMKNTIEMVRQCSQVTFILDHIAKPDIKHQILEPWSSDLKTMAEFPNVFCKISGLVTEADHQTWTRENLKPYIDQVISCFGFDRILFGGDWPVATQACKYNEWFHALEWALQDRSREKVKKLFHDNAVKVYKLL
ncbi:MAG: amidohydrolase family protein [Sedimentisphaerales bacterium]|nr:amidohydrolase family protein [Sedimentisphaerales bacterium]